MDNKDELLRSVGYSDKAIDIIGRDLNIGELKAATVQVSHQSECGDILYLDLLVEDNIIRDAGYRYIGCLGLQLAASVITELVRGMSLEKAAEIDENDIFDYAENIPSQKMDCVELAVKTLQLALWKLSYKEKGKLESEMKIVFTAKGTDWNAQIDPRFGRADYFLLFDEGKDGLATIDNRDIAEQAHGAGPKTAQRIFEVGPDVVITGNGPGNNAAQVLARSKIRVYTGAGNMTITEAYQAFRRAELSEFLIN